jgi:hypothetical protein
MEGVKSQECNVGFKVVSKLLGSYWGGVNCKTVTAEGLPSHRIAFSIRFKNAHRD